MSIKKIVRELRPLQQVTAPRTVTTTSSKTAAPNAEAILGALDLGPHQ